MKVVFDAYWWVSGPPSLRHVLRETVLEWSRLFPQDELHLVVRRAQLDAATAAAPPGSVLHPTSLWPQALSATHAVAAVARRIGADLALTHNFAARLPERTLSAVYLHDVLFATNPEWFTLAERAYFSFMLRWIQRADVVFTSSESEANRIVRNSRAERVLPVGLGLSTELLADPLDEPDPTLTPRRFVLTVGRINARKNLDALVAAALASGRISPDRPLVIVGPPDGRRARLGDRAQQAIATGALRFTGYVSEARLRWYYRNTSLFAFLSLGEGFGMPPVEAAAFAAPTLVSELPVFRETLGDRARYVDPTSLPGIAIAIAEEVDAGERRPASPLVDEHLAAAHDWNSTVWAMRSWASGHTAGRSSRAGAGR